VEVERYFEKLNNVYAKYYSPSEHLECNEHCVSKIHAFSDNVKET
jgi:hypothetical protein